MRGNRFLAMYPDCLSIRGRRHITELTNYCKKGGKGLIVFIAALPYVKAFKPNDEVDPLIRKLLKKAIEAGIAVKAISMYFNPILQSIVLDNPDLRTII